jgi:hypothetical protein
MRVYEAMACGSLMITDDRPQVHALFSDGEEIVTYTSAADLKTKVEYYLAHDGERESIARRGMEAVRQRHTYRARLESIAPILQQFVVEHRASTKLGELALSDPAKALRFVQYLDSESVVRYNRTNLKCSEADIWLRLGDLEAAGHHLDAALAQNPLHLPARRLRDALGKGLQRG